MPSKRPVSKKTLLKKELGQAARLNTVFNLKTKKQLSLRQIAAETGVSHEQVRLDLKQLQESVKSPQTIEKLSRQRMKKTPIEQAVFLNQVFNLRKQGYSISKIALKMNASEKQVQRSLETLSESVKSPRTKKWIRKGTKTAAVQRQKQVIALGKKGYSIRVIAEKLKISEKQVQKDLKSLEKE